MAAVEQREVKAVAKWVRMSPRKARLVVDHIRGRSVPEARTRITPFATVNDSGSLFARQPARSVPLNKVSHSSA